MTLNYKRCHNKKEKVIKLNSRVIKPSIYKLKKDSGVKSQEQMKKPMSSRLGKVFITPNVGTLRESSGSSHSDQYHL